MKTFEKVLEIFRGYLDCDREEEVLKCSQGYLRVTWNGTSRFCVDGILSRTPDELFEGTMGGGRKMRVIWFILKLLLKIVVAPVILALTLFVWLCAGLVYLSGLVLGLISTFFAICGVFMLIVGPRQNGIIALILAFLISPFGLPMAAIWLLGKVQALKFAIQDRVYG